MSEPVAEVLVVDDNEENRDLLTRRLRRRGYAVTAVEDGFAALEVLAARPFDLVLLDVLMPGLSGLDVLRALRQEHSPAALPVIMATARSDTEDVVEAMQLGATDYVTKPINLPVLLARIEAQLSMRRAAPEPPPEPPSVATLAVGSVLDGRYELTAELGRGGFSVVYRARQVSTGQEVAIKLIRPDLAASSADPAGEAAGFAQEMRLIGQLRHPNIVRLIDSGALGDGHVYTVLECVDGRTLFEVLRDDGPLPPAEARRLMLQVLEALSCAHTAGVVHLDLKPENIMVVASGVRRSALVLDFGLAELIQPGAAVAGELRGTPAYMAPERLRREPLTPRCDLYAWGLIFIEALTGRRAVQRVSRGSVILEHLSQRPLAVPPEVVHPALRRLIARAVAKRAEERYASAEELLADLEALPLDDRSVALPAVVRPDRASDESPTRRARARSRTLGDVFAAPPGDETEPLPTEIDPS